MADYYGTSNQSSQYNLYTGSNTKVCQSFTGNAGILKSIQVLMKLVGTLPALSAVNASLYLHSGTYGTSSVPGTYLFTFDDTLYANAFSTSFALKQFNYSAGYTLSEGTKYVLVISIGYTGDSSNYAAIGADNTSPSHSGNAGYFTGSWVADNTQDLCFYANTPGAGSAEVIFSYTQSSDDVAMIMASFKESAPPAYITPHGGRRILVGG